MMATISAGAIDIGQMGACPARYLARGLPAARGRESAVAQGEAERAFSDASELIRRPGIDAVWIAAPDPVHAALNAGLRGNGPAGVREETLGPFRRRGDIGRRRGARSRPVPGASALPAEIRSRASGGKASRAARQVGAWFHGVHCLTATVRKRGGAAAIAIDSLTHGIRSARWLMADEAIRFLAASAPCPDHAPTAVRSVALALREAVGVLECNDSADYGRPMAVELDCTRGLVKADAPRGACGPRDGRRGPRSDADGPERFRTARRAELRGGLRGVQRRRIAGLSAGDGHAAPVVAEAAIESARRGQPGDMSAPVCPARYRAGPAG